MTFLFFGFGLLVHGVCRAQAADPVYTVPESYYNSLKALEGQSAQGSAQGVSQPAVVTSSPPVTSPSASSPSSEFNNTYVLTQLGALRAEIEELKTKTAGGDKNVGYNGGFFLKTDDDKFKLGINFRIQSRYSFNIAEDIQDGHTLVFRRLFVMFSGNVYSPKAKYLFVLGPNVGTSLLAFDVVYNFAPEFALHMVYDEVLFTLEVPESSGKLMFLGKSLVYSRFGFGNSIGLMATGSHGFFSYGATVYNGISDSGFAANANQEMAYTARVDFSFLSKLAAGQSDVDHSPKPALVLGLGAVYGNYEDGTQARVIDGTADLRFKFKGLAIMVSGVMRQTDPDEFTLAQYDVGLVGQIGYFLIPKKFELAARFSALIDDLTDAGVNLKMAANLDTRLPSPLNGGDVNGDSANEWEYAAGVNYYFLGHGAKIQGQYSFLLDGMTGADERVNHIGMVQVQVQF